MPKLTQHPLARTTVMSMTFTQVPVAANLLSLKTTQNTTSPLKLVELKLLGPRLFITGLNILSKQVPEVASISSLETLNLILNEVLKSPIGTRRSAMLP